MVGFIRFCNNTTTGSRSGIFQIFRRVRILFGELLAEKNQFLECKGYIFESCLYSKLGNANVFELVDGTPFSWAACCDIFAKFFSRKEWIFWDRLDIAHCVSQLWRLFSTNPFVGSVCLLDSCIGRVVIDGGRNFAGRKFFAGEFSAKTWKTKFFIEGKCYFVALLWSNIPFMASQCWFWDGIYSLGCIQFLAENFDFSTRFCPKFFWKKFSLHMRNSLRNVYSKEFWCKFRLWGIFLWIYLRKLSKNRFPKSSTLPKTFYPVTQTIKLICVYWCPLDCVEKRLRAFQGTLGCR